MKKPDDELTTQTVKLTKEALKRLKILAVDSGKSQQALMTEAILAFLDKKKV